MVADCLRLRLLPGRVDARDMNEPNGIKDRGKYRGRETRFVTASLNDPEGGWVSCRDGSASTEVERLLSCGPCSIVDQVLAQVEKTLVQCWCYVSRLDYYLVKLRVSRDLRGEAYTETDPRSIFRR